ncbi:hypothetical protein V2J09_003709 [Rumex salicifolius]
MLRSKLYEAEFPHNRVVVYSSQPRGPLDLISLPISTFVPKKVEDFMHGLQETQANSKKDEFEVGDSMWTVLTKERYSMRGHIRRANVFNVKHRLPFYCDSSTDDQTGP